MAGPGIRYRELARVLADLIIPVRRFGTARRGLIWERAAQPPVVGVHHAETPPPLDREAEMTPTAPDSRKLPHLAQSHTWTKEKAEDHGQVLFGDD